MCGFDSYGGGANITVSANIYIGSDLGIGTRYSFHFLPTYLNIPAMPFY